MESLSEDSLCPCGSEKLYRHCCLGKVIEFPKNNGFKGESLKTGSELMEMVQDHLAGQEFSSLEELEWELRRFSENQNSLPKASFLGLSPRQMHSALYHVFTLRNEIFDFECKDPERLLKVPLVEQALYFLGELQGVGSLKATSKGNLPRAFVMGFHDAFFAKNLDWVPNRESDLFQLEQLKNILILAGLIKKRANKFSLTKKGERLLGKRDLEGLFDELTLAFFNKLNWADWDLYSELALIQLGAVFNIHLLNKMAQDWVLDKELGQAYLRAFPNLIYEVRVSYLSPEEEVIKSFSNRFLDRVCIPMGWVQSKERAGKSIEEEVYYRVSPFFKNCFKFKLK